MHLQRSSGILLHPTSLPGPHGLGALGGEAFAFIDFLAGAGQSVWQILPLSPTGYGDSPYSSFSAFAGNPLLISLERLVETGDLEANDLAGVAMPEGRANFGFAYGFKWRLLHKAALAFQRQGSSDRHQAFAEFCAHQGYWLYDYALFQALRHHFDGLPWTRWPEALRRRQPEALQASREELAETIFFQRYAQFVFFEQWFAVKEYANSRGVRILGDIPIFVSLDSVDVWANPHLFHLDQNFTPSIIAGVPPDYFSKTGQLWGNPLYRWERMAEEGFSWWLARFRWNLAQTDLVRIDHFRGFEACWAVPAGEKTAINGEWLPVPGDDLFRALLHAVGEAPIIAEDLGMITPEVEALRQRWGFPGMKVLQFAYGSGPDNLYLPHNLCRDAVIYTGTHDNDTTLGWWQGLSKKEKDEIRAYLGGGARDMPWDFIRLALASVPDLAIFPLQDILALDNSARMNVPGQSGGNWSWRFLPDALTMSLQERLAGLVKVYGRWPKKT
jgi:4-alpha-glucanotransferase